MSAVEICNRALSTYLGQERFTAFTDRVPAAEQAAIHYDAALQTLLESHWWKFAGGRQLMAELTNDRTDEWAYKYQRPTAALSIRWVNDPKVALAAIKRGEDPDTDRELVGDCIYSNVANAVCEFTKLVTDTTKMPMHFKNALGAQVAMNSAMALTEDFRRAQNAISGAAQAVEDAVVFDESQAPSTTYYALPPALTARGM